MSTRSSDLSALSTALPGVPADIISQVYDQVGQDASLTLTLLRSAVAQASASSKPRSRVQPYRAYFSSCGYCSSSPASTSHSFGMDTPSLTCLDYQLLIDRGWRRSGTFSYRPQMASTCCPQYTIRLNVLEFTPSPKHRAVLRRFNRYLAGAPPMPAKRHHPSSPSPAMDSLRSALLSILPSIPALSSLDLSPSVSRSKKRAKSPGPLPTFQSNVAFQAAAALRKSPSPSNASPHDLATLVADAFSHPSFSASADNGFVNFYATDDSDIDMSSSSSAQPSPPQPTPPAHTFTLTTVPASFDEECYQVYVKYQTTIHNDPPEDLTRERYRNFLTEHPLQPSSDSFYGAFHQIYRIDGRVVAVGVVDVLPFCLSSVYFYYDPDFKFLSLGTLSALKEIEWVRQRYEEAAADPAAAASTASTSEPYSRLDLKYYYMGFYIHDCDKMRYKAQYQPSRILCPRRFTWHRVSDVAAALDETKYVVLSEVPGADPEPAPAPSLPDSELAAVAAQLAVMHCIPRDEDNPEAYARAQVEANVDQVLFDFRDRLQRFGELETWITTQIRDRVLEYGVQVGSTLMQEMIYKLQ